MIIEASRHPAARNGCPLGNFAQELSDTHPELCLQCAQRFSESTELLKKEFDAARAQHRPRAKLDTEGLAEYFIAVLQGSLILAKAKQDTGVVERHLSHFKQYVQSLYEK